MTMGRRAVKGSGEQDLFTAWRRLYCYLNNHNRARRKIKTGARRRERREGRKVARDARREG